MGNAKISLDDLKAKLLEFDRQRNWLGLDSADLAKSIVLEAAELLELYQWDNTRMSRGEALIPRTEEDVANEAADVFIYLLKFCHENNIDLLQAAWNKIDKNAAKYPPKQ